MPTLDWIGKRAVLNHHREVPYHLLKCDGKLSVGDPGSGNLLVQGDNLLALKALLPYYAGKVKCIYIDPPYNTGNEGWVYNDAVNSPEMQAWLGKAVGAESEDLSRHDKWLCMMYPRMSLLREFLRLDGIICVNLDDNEAAHARTLMDEVFGPRNFLAAVAWEKRYTRSNNAKLFYSLKDTLLVYRRSPMVAMLKEPRTEKSDSGYKNPDNDPRGSWTTSSYVNPARKEQRSNLVYPIERPKDRKKITHPTHAWKYEPEEHERHVRENLLWWGKKGTAKYPRLKVFLEDNSAGLVPVDIWNYADSGTTDEGGAELKAIFGSAVFDNPKPTKLVKRFLRLACGPEDIVLDSFAGSGTTGHAVLDLNYRDGGNRRFILVEMDARICNDITRERVKRVAEGYKPIGSGQPVPGLGGGFRFCKLGPPLFDADGGFTAEVKFNDLAAHIWFTETGEPLPKRVQGTPLLGEFKPAGAPETEPGTALYLLFNGVLGDRRPQGGNVLTAETLAALPKHNGPRVVYGEGCRLGAERLKRAGVTFKQIPYQVKGV